MTLWLGPRIGSIASTSGKGRWRSVGKVGRWVGETQLPAGLIGVAHTTFSAGLTLALKHSTPLSSSRLHAVVVGTDHRGLASGPGPAALGQKQGRG